MRKLTVEVDERVIFDSRLKKILGRKKIRESERICYKAGFKECALFFLGGLERE